MKLPATHFLQRWFLGKFTVAIVMLGSIFGFGWFSFHVLSRRVAVASERYRREGIDLSVSTPAGSVRQSHAV